MWPAAADPIHHLLSRRPLALCVGRSVVSFVVKSIWAEQRGILRQFVATFSSSFRVLRSRAEPPLAPRKECVEAHLQHGPEISYLAFENPSVRPRECEINYVK